MTRGAGGTGTELSVNQAQTVVEQAKANYAAQVRSRAQAENLLVLLVGQPLPADLPAGQPFNSQAFLADTLRRALGGDLTAYRSTLVELEREVRAAFDRLVAERAPGPA